MSKAIQQWLKLARSDLGLAKLLVENKFGYELHVCFHSQQSVEKMLKAFLTKHRKRFPKTHDIEKLLKFIKPLDEQLSVDLSFAEFLSDYAVSHRYPDAAKEEVTATKAKDALKAAILVSEIVLAKL